MASRPATEAALPNLEKRSGKQRRKANDQTIYESIYDAVLTQRLPPGSKLPEVALGELFGVSRSIVRKALTRLAADHVIEQRPNQMATVAKPSVEETQQIFEARKTIEAEVVRLCAGALSKGDLQSLRQLIKEEKAAHESGQHQERVHRSMGLHLFLADHCPNRVLGKIQRELVLRTSIVIALYKVAGVQACFLGDDHSRLVEFIAKGKGDQAAALVREHLDTLADLLDLKDQQSTIDLASILRP
ncbi:GntR family transcriptional regulator [Alkalilimnicola ehrlichii]|uniref:GntR family transcriptional regulator n=1 Tax=Alkalilimnicola ehrlichii TaxID=351052 RepID=A0A3E0X2K8_9GAMM|nr:GntR family transcriptional regulator [Alkalilimnicola ehrlichii]RFA24478.1 GntR family transcriptional regulator [Alkalilimnicola ehrlichii]RFA38484.1 GntR family transcriptional regulator [Alkalilimnicola ehrlichii]